MVCTGNGEQPCIFKRDGSGQPARIRKQDKCHFCSPEMMTAALGSKRRKLAMVEQLANFHGDILTKAMEKIPETSREHVRNETEFACNKKKARMIASTLSMLSTKVLDEVLGQIDPIIRTAAGCDKFREEMNRKEQEDKRA